MALDDTVKRSLIVVPKTDLLLRQLTRWGWFLYCKPICRNDGEPGSVVKRPKGGFRPGGGQALPADFPTEPMVRYSPITGEGFTPEELEFYGEQLIGQWRALTGPTAYPWVEPGNDAPYGTGLDLGYGATFGNFGLVISGTHRHTYEAYEDDFREKMVEAGLPVDKMPEPKEPEEKE